LSACEIETLFQAESNIAGNTIPTLSQWGVIILGLLLLVISVVRLSAVELAYD